MFRAHHPTRSNRAHLGNPSSSAASSPRGLKPNGRPKRARSPCEDEVAFKELHARMLELQHRVRQQMEVLSGLENNILEFYYTHTLRFEPLLEVSSHTHQLAVAVKVGAAAQASAIASTVRGGLPELFADTENTEALTGACDEGDFSSAYGPVPVPSQTVEVPTTMRYYYDSALMRLYREASFQERVLAGQYASEKDRVEEIELCVQRDILEGSLAAQLLVEEEERKALNKLAISLAEVMAKCTADRQSLEVADERIRGIEKAKEACLARKMILETKKQEQMDNAERIKEEVAAFRRCVDDATGELETRRQINRGLEEEIRRRRAAMKRRKKE
ncbi:hypothetical protein JKF63_01748 [Porcisia hertigi]|uniref:Uncharacterized protein n=1 Tax=Porcisia hertigi TaxID=2761500 RepID=A0A836IB64_9TRYP|nr:hypothetical protein JKF63_01748 [Porcisia hertigi]